MTPEVQSLIDQLRDHMAGMTAWERGQLYSVLMDGYMPVSVEANGQTNTWLYAANQPHETV